MPNRIPRSASKILPGLMLAFLLPAWSGRAAQGSGEFQLAGLSVIGSKRYEESEIAPLTGLKVGDDLTLKALQEAANRLASIGVFAQVSYHYTTRGDELSAVFTVQDADGLLPCTFANFVWFARQQLLDELRSRVPLFEGYVPPAGKMLDQVIEQLRAILEARGLHAQIQYSEVGPLGGPVQGIEFKEVGVPVPVQKIEFTGVEKIDPALLQKAASPLLKGSYDASFIRDFSQGALRDVYRQRGYLRARFGEPVPRLLAGGATPNAVGVTIPVSEGEQYRLAKIIWSGESVIPYAELAKTMNVKSGRPLNAVQLEQDVLGLPLLFHQKGYLMADASGKAVLDDANHSAVYQIAIRQGDLFHMGRLEVSGLDGSEANLVERLSQLRPGDPYRPAYWNSFSQQVARRLPPSEAGYMARTKTTIHAGTKTVDVRLVFSPIPNP